MGAGEELFLNRMKRAEQIFRRTGAVLEGHFLLSSGLHSPVYWEKFRVLQYPGYTEQLCRLIAQHFQNEGVQVVAGPELGGVVLAYEVARQLGVRAVFAEKSGGGKVFRRGAGIGAGEQVLVVDDVLTTGGSLQQVIGEVIKQAGKVVGAGVLVDRTSSPVNLGVPLFSCLKVSIPTYDPADCPLCAAGIPLTEPGGQSLPVAKKGRA